MGIGLKSVGGEECGSVLLLGRHLMVPNPQEDKNEEDEIERFSVDTKGGIPREQNRELTTT